MHAVKTIAIAAALCVPMSVSAFERIEDIVWPDDGRFPAYPTEPDPRPVVFSVSGGYYHDDNVFRASDSAVLPPGTQKSDNIYRVGVGLRANLPYSQQRFLINARVDNFTFDNNGRLDHVDYRFDGTWRWQAGSRLSGDLGYWRRRYLGDLGEIQVPLRDMITEDRIFGSAGFMLTPRWRVRGAADWRQWDHSEATRSELDLKTTSGTVGLDYVTPLNNSFGVQFKGTHGEYDNRQAIAPGTTVANTFDEYETSGVVRYNIGPRSLLTARVGYTRREHDEVPARDFDGFTGRLSLDWAVGAKTILNGSIWREIRSVEEFGTLEQAAASFIISSGLSIGPTWAPTSKLVFEAKYVHEKREYEGDPTLSFPGSTGIQREDTINGLRLAVGYAPRRNIRLSLAGERGDRDSNIFLRDYEYNRVSANERFEF
jgi:exopolysaccharide biosynthesis operon protein EpsL